MSNPIVRHHPLITRICCALGVLYATAVPAAAQATRVIGPFAGLFGGDKGDRSQSLDFRATLFGAYNADVVTGADAATLAGTGLGQSGSAGGADGSISYIRKGPRVHFSVDGTGAFEQYAAGPFGGPSYLAASALGANFTPKLLMDANFGAMHTPYYQFAPSLIPDSSVSPVPLVPGYGVAAAAAPTTSFAEGLSLVDNFSKRSSITAEAHGFQTKFGASRENTDFQNFSEFGGTISFQHHISRPLSFHLGYGRDQLRDAAGSSAPVIQSVDVGLDYNDVLSFARTTTLSFSVSTSAVRAVGVTNYTIDGYIKLSRGFARTWTASAQYVRSTVLVPGFTQPLLSDAVDATIAGLLAPRLHWSADVGYSFGQIGFDNTQPAAVTQAGDVKVGAPTFGVWTASSTLESALNRRLGVFVQYSFYRYRIPAGTTDLPLFPLFSQHVATVGLSAYFPIIKPKGAR